MLKDAGLTATEIVFDEMTGFSTRLELFSRQSLAEMDKVESRVLRAPIMALSQPDPALGFPSATVLDPKILLRNAGPAPVVILPGVNWRNDGKSGTSPLPPIPLLPGQLRIFSLADFQRRGRIPADATWATVTLGYTGRSADLVAIAMSYDKTGRYGLQTPFSEVINYLFKGSMWHVDATHNTIITTGNGGTEPTRAQVTLFYDGGQNRYRVEKLLPPGRQLWLNVGDVVRNQVPDSDGKTVPPDVMFGSYELRDLDHAVNGLLYEGKLVVDKTYGHASYGCTTCCGYNAGQLSPTSFSGPPNINNQDVYQAYNVCSSSWEDFDAAFNPTSSNSAVATLSSSLMTHTVGAGTATVSAKNLLTFQASRTSGCVNNTPITGKQAVAVKPAISGPTTLWWFKGLSQGVSGYNNQVTLTGSPLNGTYQWQIAIGSDKVTLSNSTTNNVQVTSIGQSTKTNDVSITATVNGQTSAPFTLTVRAPYALGIDPNTCCRTPTYVSDPTYVWQTDIWYQVLDNLLTPMPTVLPINEYFTTAIIPEYSGTNWDRGGAGCIDLNPDATFADGIYGEYPSYTPRPVYNPNWTGVKVITWGQDWHIGTCVNGSGPRVQSDSIQKWTDHALHQNIVSPAP